MKVVLSNSIGSPRRAVKSSLDSQTSLFEVQSNISVKANWFNHCREPDSNSFFWLPVPLSPHSAKNSERDIAECLHRAQSHMAIGIADRKQILHSALAAPHHAACGRKERKMQSFGRLQKTGGPTPTEHISTIVERCIKEIANVVPGFEQYLELPPVTSEIDPREEGSHVPA